MVSQSVGSSVSWSYSHTNGKGSIFQPQEKRSNHSRLQRQSKHGALRRLQGQAAAPFPDKSSSRFAASVFIGKTLYPTAPCKRAFENGNDRPATHRPKGKNKVGLRGSRWQGQPPQKGRRTARRRVFTEKIP
ncbi:hypothetical protein [Parabacteroides distasonis]|uniref:hypothetical protein n=1 Tax=Parabacteroides distasonis TaxID=823 RepID=UPI001F4182CB|nr:hypothetical protein [Parabacteroides distasonis]